MLSLVAAPVAFSPVAVPPPRTAVRTNCPIMAERGESRRQFFTKAGAAVFGAVLADSASAKAGQFGKIGIFDMEDLSSPYVPGGPKAGADATFGYAKSEGPMLAKDYKLDVSREKAAFLESSKRISSLQPKIDSKTWWFVRDEMRNQAYNMRSSMLAMNDVNPDKAAAEKAYKKYWSKVEQFDLACAKKESALANQKYAEVLEALKAYSALV